MKNHHRITSILQATSLDSSVTGFASFDLPELELATDLDFQLPTNLRLGHLAEKVVAQLIHSSANYQMLHENIQLIEDKRTIGEMDFIVAKKNTQQLIHVELAYKFYLLDPSISSKTINNWIGPNRNDSLTEKLDKLRAKQFPLLYHPAAKSKLDGITIGQIEQKLCLLVSLFLPYQYQANLPSVYQKAIKGYYLNFETFANSDHLDKDYHLPQKTAWGMDPATNEEWKNFSLIKEHIEESVTEKQAVLCWQRQKDSYSTFFIVWW